MIKNKKTTSRFMAIISAVIAVAILSAAVFASGVLSDLTSDDYTVELTNNGKKVELANKPFIENGEVYVPLRELFEKAGVMDHPDSKIEWNNGKIDLSIAYSADDAETYETHKSLNNGKGIVGIAIISNYVIEIEKPTILINTHSFSNISDEKIMDNVPLLKGSNTYIPYSYISTILNATQWNIDYSIYDKNGNIIETTSNQPTVVKISQYNNTTPEYTIDQFFYLFGDGDFDNMKKYCTQSCIDAFFKNDSVFGMKKASLTELNIDPKEYAKSSNGFNAFVTVDMTPHELSVFDPGQTSTSFYVILERQSDGRYLINNFATGL